MGIFKRAHLRGMVHELTRMGVVSWPTKLAEEMAADEIADEMPEEVVPEQTGDEGLTPEQAQAALEQIVQVAEQIAEKTGHVIHEDTCKIASEQTYEDAASHAAVAVMEKAAMEASGGPTIPGQVAATPDLSATSEGAIDAATTPSAAIVGPQGTTEVDTSPGMVGAQERRMEQPGGEGTPPTNEAAKTASAIQSIHSMLQKMSAVDGASLSGGAAQGPAPTPRVDLDDNLNIPGVVASSQGTTVLDIPAAATIGVTKKQPAGTPGPTAATPNEPAKDAVKQAMEVLKSSPTGQILLQKLAKDAKEKEEKKKKENPFAEMNKKKEEKGDDKEEKSDDKEEKDGEKEAQLLSAFHTISTAINS